MTQRLQDINVFMDSGSAHWAGVTPLYNKSVAAVETYSSLRKKVNKNFYCNIKDECNIIIVE